MDETITIGSEPHEHVPSTSESLISGSGIPYDLQQVRCTECGEVLEQEKKRIIA